MKTVNIEVSGTHLILRIAVDGFRLLHSDGKAEVKLSTGKHALVWQMRTNIGTKYSVSVKQGDATLAERKDLSAALDDELGFLDFTVGG